ncbi:hypothetical protein PR048_021690 [Dryococelus australis]|uniref:Uncharacterized protein n=1 Tax=Dryococelus australis TaxID=614101 RepID=A0ABQ9GZ47_9NEOP|nr:hypothetical protein PR048_021690 [Dryococelus australis]
MFPNNTQFELAKRKGVFPCDFIKSEDSLMCTSLPLKDTFHVMKGEGVSDEDEDYAHTQATWGAFHCLNMLQYAIQYLRVVTCLLADVFENFRIVCLAHYGLNPAMYVTAPCLAWDALLSMTDVRLELLMDPDMYLFVEDVVSRRRAKAYNIYMSEEYDPSVASKYICYFDDFANTVNDGVTCFFLEMAWMTPSIKFNIDKHAQAANDIGKLYDTIYGAAELFAHHTFQARQIIDENLFCIEMSKSSVTFNKLLYTGVAILDFPN